MPRTQFTTFLFDLDGTLIDSIELIRQSFRYTFSKHRDVIPDDDLWLATLGTPLRSQLSAFATDDEELEQMVATYRQFNFENYESLLRRYPGVLEAVQTLKRRGLRLGIVTSKARRGTNLGLELCGYTDAFDVIVSADDVEKHKPDPEPILQALDLLNATPEEALFVGDSPHDLAAGRNADVATAAVLWGPFSREQLGPHEPTHWLQDPSELLQLARTPVPRDTLEL